MLPVNFLRQLIGLYGGSMQSTVPQYLDAAMDAFSKNQDAMRTAFSGNFGGANVFADIAKRNMAMFEEAGKAFAAAAPARAAAAEKDTASEVDKLRAELAALQAKVDKLGK
jgi:polyhydroxyalkanoate synthesis regulator protein